MTSFEKLYRRLLRRFREDFPTLYPVKVRMTSMPEGEYGETTLIMGKGGPYISIRISKDESEAAKFLALIHELAHAVDYGTPSQEESRAERYQRGHGPTFGVAYADLFERLVGSVGE